jgi:RNA polymerase sigma-70 factor (ECF subfamily)
MREKNIFNKIENSVEMKNQEYDLDREKQLLNRAKSGDQQAFAQIYEYYYDKLLAYTLRKTSGSDKSLDIVANVFISVMESLENFTWNDDMGLKPWIYRICSNEINQYFRDQYQYKAKFAVQDNDDELLEIKQESQTQFEEYLSLREVQVLQDIIEQLSGDERELIEMRYEQELSYRQIAAQTGEKSTTLRSRVSRLLAKLREEVKHELQST